MEIREELKNTNWKVKKLEERVHKLTDIISKFMKSAISQFEELKKEVE